MQPTVDTDAVAYGATLRKSALLTSLSCVIPL